MDHSVYGQGMIGMIGISMALGLSTEHRDIQL